MFVRGDEQSKAVQDMQSADNPDEIDISEDEDEEEEEGGDDGEYKNLIIQVDLTNIVQESRQRRRRRWQWRRWTCLTRCLADSRNPLRTRRCLLDHNCGPKRHMVERVPHEYVVNKGPVSTAYWSGCKCASQLSCKYVWRILDVCASVKNIYPSKYVAFFIACHHNCRQRVGMFSFQILMGDYNLTM